MQRRFLMLFLIVIGVLSSFGFFYYVYAATSVNYVLDGVEIAYLFESEQKVKEEYSMNLENCNLDTVVIEDKSDVSTILKNVENITLNGADNMKIIEYEEEFVVNNKLSARNIAQEVGSEYETVDEKYYRIFGIDGVNKRGRVLYYPGGESEALKDMVYFKINVWSLDGNNNWYQRTVGMQTHKNIETTVKCIFNDLLALPPKDRIPIETIGCYNYRTGSSCHTCGVAIDINWEQNAEMTNSGVITAGSYWRPYEDIYSIPPDSKMVEIFAKYGFGWGGFWTSKKDYMHFSYFDR